MTSSNPQPHAHASHGAVTTPPAPQVPLKEPRLDAGNKHHDHYARALPAWRNALRQRLIPIVRWETPYLALLQDTIRTPALDSYFAFTANLGTHTFFMVFLPILFWCGYTNIGRAMVHMLAAGVFFSGFLKDMLCLPRPLSPPLYRISMSGSAALEYGFPSSHSTNAVSVAIYAIYMLKNSPEPHHPTVNMAFQALFYFYAVSIVFGRLYCGMHGFLDVIIGSIIGAMIAVVQLMFGDRFDSWIPAGPFMNPLIAILVILVFIRIHPEPADDCPCFDDSISFNGVVIGCQLGAWHYARTGFAIDHPIPSTVPFSLQEIGMIKATIRIVVGVVIVFFWRAAMKPALFRILPPIFRVLEQVRLNLPRAFFLNASKYTVIPTLRGDDNVIPPASELPRMLNNLAHPRKRSVSVGPQSAADAYETLAYRNRRRRESLNSADGTLPEDLAWSPGIQKKASIEFKLPSTSDQATLGSDLLPTPIASRVHSYEKMMGTGEIQMVSVTPPDSDGDFAGDGLQTPAEAANEKRQIFMSLMKPRVRYDVEVITKLIIYTGIAWLAVEGNPLLFELFGLSI
ncbi:sphingosine-1-phosphate phosphohydrolase-like protein [Dendryphion nanum]|uniref:Sphingosine-1-phosphate phosphohydrolase-like protein n=1 Tax=Dendryphion nanum TaxID=256645 RepID=A0A9P9IC05_9PLEO|nr:sphingosine-1-phosphate phosphohydrolase-like protein [Dendryphion nanum]